MSLLGQIVSIAPIIKEILKLITLAVTSIFVSHGKIFASADLYWLRCINKTLIFYHLRGIYVLLFCNDRYMVASGANTNQKLSARRS